MLKKLIKHDLKGALKFLLIFYSLGIFFAILTRLFLNVDNSAIANIIGQICSGVTISMIFNILINNIFRCWVRFRQSLYGDESYLTHTLPVNKKKIYLAKFIFALITMLISVVIIAIILFIAYYSKDNIELLKTILLPVANIYNSSIMALLVVIIFIFFLEMINLLQAGYTGTILGHKMNNNKIAYSFLYSFISYMISQIFVLLVIFVIALFNKDIMNLFITNEILNFDIIKIIVLVSTIVYTLIIIINYFINYKLLKKGVNVD